VRLCRDLLLVSFLGVCLTKKKVYCCFESKLSRILQEQGRQQLNKPWGKPKTEQCLGFTIDEFARLDLSKMDFSEVYAEFTDAARLPDELQAATEIQQKIEDYYARATPVRPRGGCLPPASRSPPVALASCSAQTGRTRPDALHAPSDEPGQLLLRGAPAWVLVLLHQAQAAGTAGGDTRACGERDEPA
jgi:hypothetical protein